MLSWIKSTLQRILIGVGLTPVLEFCLDFLEDKANQTSTPYDNDGVEVIREVVASNDYTIDSLLDVTSLKLVEISDRTSNKIDDIFADTVREVVITGEYTGNNLITAFLNQAKLYTEQTETPFDDIAYGIVVNILKETGVIE
jgi:hypothetical protein